MRINAQHSNQVDCLSVLRPHSEGAEATLLLTSDSPEITLGLDRVFEMHEAPYLPLDGDFGRDLKAVGDCILRQDGIKIVVEGLASRGFMGMLFEIDWTRTDEVWRDAAEANGRVWLTLLDFPAFERIRISDIRTRIPLAAPTLKLDTVL